MNPRDSTALTAPEGYVLPAFEMTVENDPWLSEEPVSLSDLADWSRRFNGKTESNALIVGSSVAELLGVDYAALEMRALVVFASGSADWPSPRSDNPAKACTRLMDCTPGWPEFERHVDGYAPFRDYHDQMVRYWDRLVAPVVRDPPGTRKRWTPVPHQTTGAEALALWNGRS